MEDSEPNFSSPELALQHYRNLSLSLQRQLEEANNDIQDFTESSKELQDELESELLRMEKGERELRRELEEARGEGEDWKSKYTNSLNEHSSTLNHLQKELEGSKSSTKLLNIKLRDMELDNDNLEKSEREKDSSLKDWKLDLETRLERIAFLEEELLNKTQLEEEIQRLKDELRDATEEISVLKLHTRSLLLRPPHLSQTLKSTHQQQPTSIDPDNNKSRPLSPPQQASSPPYIYQPILGAGTLSRSARLKELTLRLESRRNLTLVSNNNNNNNNNNHQNSIPSTSNSNNGGGHIPQPRQRPKSIILPSHSNTGMTPLTSSIPSSSNSNSESRTSTRPTSAMSNHRASMLRPPSRQFAAPLYDFSTGLSNSQKSTTVPPNSNVNNNSGTIARPIQKKWI